MTPVVVQRLLFDIASLQVIASKAERRLVSPRMVCLDLLLMGQRPGVGGCSISSTARSGSVSSS